MAIVSPVTISDSLKDMAAILSARLAGEDRKMCAYFMKQVNVGEKDRNKLFALVNCLLIQIVGRRREGVSLLGANSLKQSSF
jgi:hypothetical protein